MTPKHTALVEWLEDDRQMNRPACQNAATAIRELSKDAERWHKAQKNWPWMMGMVDALDEATESK